MEQEPRYTSEEERPIDPGIAAPEIELLFDAATGITYQTRPETNSPLVTREEHKAENPYSQ